MTSACKGNLQPFGLDDECAAHWGSRMRSLKGIIDRAEMDLKAKAEAVLSSTFSDNFTGQEFVVPILQHLSLVLKPLAQFYQPFVESSLFCRVDHHLKQVADALELLDTLPLPMLPPTFAKRI